ncbi:MAG: HipA domain-containing protein [Erysipelotrichaceae bacterium]|nr:HipA domain-containing protein [Erysipelotrichaceae bacterium]
MSMILDDKKFYNFSDCEHDSFINYGGSDQKGSIIIGNKRFMLKYANHNEKVELDNSLATSNVNNVLSEYIGSHIVSTLDLEVQNTFLGECDGRLLVACENFLNRDEYLLEFGNYLNQMYTSSSIGRTPTYEQIYNVIYNHTDLSKIFDEAIEMYWDLFVVDALIGNFDRHRGNWGYIYNLNSKTIVCSPIYDCGSCLYPNLSETGMLKVLSEEGELLNRVFSFPRAALIVGGKNKVSYYDMLSSGYDKYCTKSLLKIAPKININRIKQVVDNTSNK